MQGFSPGASRRARLPRRRFRRPSRRKNNAEVIAEAAAVDHAALGPLPATEYEIFDEHVRTVGKDCLISFESDHYSVPASQVTAWQKVLVRATASRITVCRLEDPAQVLAVHRRGGRSRVDYRPHPLGQPARRGRPRHLPHRARPDRCIRWAGGIVIGAGALSGLDGPGSQ